MSADGFHGPSKQILQTKRSFHFLGYYSRVAAMRKVISLFLNSIPREEQAVQIVNLGELLMGTVVWYLVEGPTV